MDRAMRMVMAAGLTLLLSSLSFMGYLLYLRNNPPTAAAAQGGGITMTGDPLSIPEFSLVDQDGAARDKTMLLGRVTIVWFMFTRCPIACPAMSVQMEDLQRDLKGSGVRFAAFSLEPLHDTPAVLKKYGDERYNIDWSNWTFLTEPAGSTRRQGWDIFKRDLGQHVEETPEIPSDKPNVPPTPSSIDHGVNFFVVGPDGKVLDQGWYSSKYPDEMKKLRERALAAMKYYGDKGDLKK